MPFITINEQPIPFRLRRSQKVRRLQLLAKPEVIEIVAPLRISNKEALRFLWQHRSWMLKQHLRKTTRQTTTHEWKWPDAFLAQETIPFRGERLLLQVKFAQEGKLLQHATSLVVTLPWHKTLASKVDHTVKQLILRWYQQQASQIIQQTLEHYCPLLGRWPTGFVLKRQKTRWGSCGISGKIHINWLLILAPPGVLEYVVVHELCHLFYRNHGKRFWEKIARCLPDYERYDKWLNKMGHSLHRPIY